MPNYGTDTKILCRMLYVQQRKNPNQIARQFHNRPNANTITNWAIKGNWDRQRQEWEDAEYEKISPQALATRVIKRIIQTLDDPDFNNKSADALAKLQKTLEKIVDIRYQIPIMYQLLTDLVEFLQANHKKLISVQLIDAIRDFRNEIRRRLG